MRARRWRALCFRFPIQSRLNRYQLQVMLGLSLANSRHALCSFALPAASARLLSCDKTTCVASGVEPAAGDRSRRCVSTWHAVHLPCDGRIRRIGDVGSELLRASGCDIRGGGPN